MAAPRSPHAAVADRLRIAVAYDDDVGRAADALLAVLGPARADTPAPQPDDAEADEAQPAA